MKPVRVLLVDDHTLFRAGIRMLLEKSTGVKVVAEARTGREALRLTKTARPDVVLMDITMKDLNGLEAAAYIVQEHPQVRVLMLFMHDNEQYVTQALRVGASGYLLKEAAPTELEAAVKTVARGDTYLSPAVAKHVSADYRRRGRSKASPGAEVPSPDAVVTPREREVLYLIVEGLTTKEIAVRLHLSTHTVETYRRRLMRRLGVHNVTGLIRAALRLGVLLPDR